MSGYTSLLNFWTGTPGNPAIKNAWGAFLNTNMSLIEQAIAGDNGYAGGSGAEIDIAGLTTYTLTVNDGSADQARQLLYPFTGALSGTCTVTIASSVKVGWAMNATTGSRNVVLTSGAGSANLTLPPDGLWHFFYCDGNGHVTSPGVAFGNFSPAGTLDVGTLNVGTLASIATLEVTAGATIAGGATVDILTVGTLAIVASETIGASGTQVAINGGIVHATGSIQSDTGGFVFPDSTDQLTAYGGAVAPSPSNLAITVTSSTAITTTANAVATKNGSAQYQTILSFNKSIATGTSGAGGLDTGSIASSTVYYVFAISGASGNAAMLSLSATAPTMPSGYTFFSRLGAVITNASANLLGTVQKGRRAQYVVGGANVSALPAIITGNSGSIGTPTWTAINVVSGTQPFVPATADAIRLVPFIRTTSGAMGVAPNNSYGAYNSSSNPPPLNFGSTNLQGASIGVMLLESSNIYYYSNEVNSGVVCLGWEDNL